MTTFIPKDNTGNLFKVKPEDRKGDTWPEYEGEFKSVCPHCGAGSTGWIKGWIRESKAGSKFFSIALKFRTQSKS